MCCAAVMMSAAGLAAPVQAEVAGEEHLRILERDGVHELVLGSGGGHLVHRAPERISSAQMYTFAESPHVLATWTQQSAQGAEHYWAVSRDGTRIDLVRRTENRVRLRYDTFDPLVRVPRVPDALAAGPDNELYLVQFIAPPLDDMRAEVTALGGEVQRYLADHTHVVRMTEADAQRVRALPHVRWVGPYHPAYRLDEMTLGNIVGMAIGGEAAGAGVGEGKGVWQRYGIELMGRGLQAQQPVADLITRLGGLVELTDANSRRMEATLTLDQVIALAHRPDVNFIDPWEPPHTNLDAARIVSGAVPTLSSAGFLGQGVRAEVIDSGIQMNHPEWAGRTPILHRPVNVSFSGIGHGTSVYGCLFSSGVNPVATGFLPQYEAGIFGHLMEAIEVSRVTWALESVDPAGPYRVILQTNSWGITRSTGAYTTLSAELDDAVVQSNLLITQAQGNLAGLESSAQAWAKNVVSVGGIQHNNSPDPLTHSGSNASHGPAADGRIKPDLAHFYDNVFTTTSGSTYRSNFGGTSAATPLTAGVFGLVMQMWHEGVWPGFGGGSTVFESRPHYATAKALVIAGAHRYNWTSGSTPNASLTRPRQGWGLAHAGRLYEMRDRTFIVNGTDAVETGTTQAYMVEVAPGEPELFITMVYNDAPGNPAAVVARVNDLDLRVTSPAGAEYLGNHGLVDDNWSTPAQGAEANAVDTVENVFIQNPDPGTWLIEVIGAEVVVDMVPSTPATQANFGLAVLGAVDVGEVCYADCDDNGMLNIDDFLCFINAFAAARGLPPSQQIGHYANCDGSTTAPVLTIDDFLCFINAFAAGCP